ncbi:MAG TPA: twitch domain-containing radical SAM protein [Thermoanaerobaculia bacterium]|nr:twitch domain-containing radical SAM protein [Thermoanaerobaculia bacterium]
MSKTACIVPWSTLAIGPDGRANFCCDVPAPLTVDGRMGSIYRDSLDNLWNAGEIVQVRAAMARGEKPEACGLCWQREAAGGVSRRLLTNAAYRQLGGQLAVEALPQEGAGSGYRLERRPDWFILELGNVCNLKCRSCSPLFSSRIAADPVQVAWTGNAPAPDSATTTAPRPRQRLRLAPENTAAWFEDVDAMADMIASGAGGGAGVAGGAGGVGDVGARAMLSLMGGEPFLIEHTWRLLDALVARGVAPHLFVGLLSNGQQRSVRLEELAPHFRGFNVSLSIDAHGKLYEYLRNGARWRTLVENLRWLRQVPNLYLAAVPTLQNCNALDMVTLLRFLDEQELPVTFNLLTWPARLRPTNLPPSVRRIAAARLRGYLDTECRPVNLAVVRNYCETLEEAGDSFDAELFAEFMTFTNDLDASRGESLPEAAPELLALVRAAGVEWSDERRHVPSGAPRPALRQDELLQRVNRTVSSHDVLFAGFEAVETGAYFTTAASQLWEIDALLREHGHQGLAGCRAVADFACHYGRLTRALRAALPHAAVYACDIDRGAVQFCADELGALPVVTGWRPDEERLPGDLDAVVCVSLLTHTPLEHWRHALRAWARMLRPGGIAAFTYLSERHLDPWLVGAMEHYGSYSREQRRATVRSLRQEGHGFAALTSGYGGEPFYGIAFATSEVVRREIAAAGFELLALPAEASPTFGQDLALVRRPDEQGAPRAAAVAAAGVRRDVSLVALYDPRCYAPADGEDGSHPGSAWARLAAAPPPRPLPTQLGFGDPRVPEVREAQAALAREHAVDAFCYLYPWGVAGPRWDAPWRDLLATGRPDFPFCLMVDVEDGEPIAPAAAGKLFDDIAPGLGDRRYLRVEGRALLIVRGVTRLLEARAIAAQWRAAATSRGLGELHLCAAEPAPADRPEDLGFDSYLETPEPAADRAGAVAASLTRPWPAHRFFRAVECRRDADPRSGELYEHWLRSTIEATRRRGESLVFVDAWNDWPRGVYLEPDDRDGRAALQATRRAARGPASGLVLLRELRDELGGVGGRAAAVLGELGEVLALHEHTRDRLLASVEAALGRNQTAGPETQRWVPVASRHLPPSGGGFCLDRVGSAAGAELHRSGEPIPLPGDEVNLAGWAHAGNCAPAEVDLFLALESSRGTGDRIFRVTERVARPDVVAALPGHPAGCGFNVIVDLRGLPPGTYFIAIVQRTPDAAFRDATAVAVERR